MIIHPYYLCATSLLLVFTLIFFIVNSNKNVAECYLSICLLATIFFSQLFWRNPIKNSLIHRIDAIIAKISFISFILYTILYKNLNIYLLVSYILIMVGGLYTFYNSHKYSSEEWCCNNHLIYHGCSHLLCFIGSFCAFL